MSDPTTTIARITAQMDVIRSCREAELRRLCEAPDKFEIAQALTDAMVENLTYLCHFQSCLDGYGNPHSMLEVGRQLETYILETFQTLTGREYVPTVCRSIDHGKGEQKP